MRAQLDLGDGVLELDDRPDVLLAGDHPVRHAERPGAAYRRMIFERVLDARRVDVAPAAEYERVGAAAELERAVGAKEADVAGRVGSRREVDELAARRHVSGRDRR